MIKFSILGNPPTKKNNNRIIYNQKTGKPMILPSKKYLDYKENVLKQKEKGGIPSVLIDYPINIQSIYYRDSRRKVDLCNLHAALHDILQDIGVIEDDSCRIIVSTNGSRVDYDPEKPRTEIQITKLDDYRHPFDR